MVNVKTAEQILESAVNGLLDNGRKEREEVKRILSTVISFVSDAKRTFEKRLDAIDNKVTKRLSELRDGRDGRDGKDGKRGERGEKGESAEPLDPYEVALQVYNLIDIPQPPSYDEEIEELSEQIEELNKKIKTLSKSKGVFGGGGVTVFGSVSHTPQHESFSMNGVATSVTLAQGVAANGTAIMVRLQGQMLDLTTHYTVDGNKVSFTFTPENGSTVSVTYWP